VPKGENGGKGSKGPDVRIERGFSTVLGDGNLQVGTRKSEWRVAYDLGKSNKEVEKKKKLVFARLVVKVTSVFEGEGGIPKNQ